MNSQSPIRDRKSAIVVVGAGPAGSSAAIRLARAGFETVLVERKHFPRQKLCGEFISPECLRHFKDLCVDTEMLDAGGDRVLETRFYEVGGRSVSVPTSWFGSGEFALSLSRAVMDNILLEKARSVGVKVLDGFSIVGIEQEKSRLSSIKARSDDGSEIEIKGDLFIDATGRTGTVRKLVERSDPRSMSRLGKPGLVGFKTHVSAAGISKGICEIYSFPGGYAGLSNVEDGFANLCFLIKSDVVRSSGGDAQELVARVVSRNKRASESLKAAMPQGEWLAVSIDGFGARRPSPAENLFAIGDAASFIDPFTGSGMVMAFESAEILANILTTGPLEYAAHAYAAEYHRAFQNRLRVCSVLRRSAFMPRLATLVVSSLGVSTAARRALARSTRG